MPKPVFEPIAIVGIGCRFPGGVTDASSFWQMIASGADGIVDVPPDRWNIDRFFDENRDTPGKMYVRAGGFLQQRIDEFDARFFGMSPREAGYLDPQQRLLLETAWEAFEDAGIDPQAVAGSDAGVYVGGFMTDNLLTQLSPLNREAIGAHSEVGSTLCILSNRLSYVFDLRGPSMTIDTACSSSLVAFHQACTAMARGDCSLALVGGVNVMHRPENLIAMCKGGFLSPDGRSKSFDARADGYGRGEGAGVVVLKPLSQALADQNEIYAIVRGTGVNQDGRTDGITVPNPAAQQQLVERVCAEAGVEPAHIRYMEAHGTGTPVGDPLEASALGSALGQRRASDDPCIVGSVKANIGHLEAAAGVAGVIKACLVLRHRQIPPVANLRELNPNIPFDKLNLRVPRTLEALPEGDGPVCVGINSFGYGGTNAHAVLEAAPRHDASADKRVDGSGRLYLFPFSARSKEALTATASHYAQWLSQDGHPDLADLAFSLATRRAHHDQRIALVASTKEALAAQLTAFASGAQGAASASVVAGKGQRPVFVFSGMGPQWWAMGRELYHSVPVFADTLREIDALFAPLAGWSILEEMLRDEAESRITQTQIAQPANFALQVALAAYWRSLGVEPAAIVGHSVGEVAAAHVAGVLTLEQAVLVSYWRSHIQSKAAGQGGMLAVGLTENDASRYIDGSYGNVCIAAVNAPAALTLAGEREGLARIKAELEAQGVFQRELVVEMAYHSAYMDPLKPMLLEALTALTPSAAQVPLYSTVTGLRATPGMYDAAYWCDNVREPVAFAQAIGSLLADGHRAFLEVGPHPVLSGSVRDCAAHSSVKAVTFFSLRRNTPEQASVWENFANMYQAGVALDLGRASAPYGRPIRLPTYFWQRDRHWQEAAGASFDRVGQLAYPLLGQRTQTPDTAWEALLNANMLPYLRDHCVEELTILPGAAYVELGLAVQRALGENGPLLLDRLHFFKALVIDSNRQPLLRVTFDPEGRRYKVFSSANSNDGWQLHAVGRVAAMPDAMTPQLDIAPIRARCDEHITGDAHYADMNERGLHYGPWFQGIKSIWRNRDEREVLARIDAHADLVHDTHSSLHPTLLDASFQALLAATRDDPQGLGKEVYVPVRIGQVRFYARPQASFYCYTRLSRAEPGRIVGDVTLTDEQGRVFAEIQQVEARALTNKRGDALAALDDWLYQFEWRPSPVAAEQAPLLRGPWLVLAEEGPLADQLAHALGECGVERAVIARCRRVEDASSSTGWRLDPKLSEFSPNWAAGQVQGVVSLLATELTDEHIGAQLSAATSGALQLVQSLTKTELGSAPHVVFVTRRAQSVDLYDAESMCVAQAPLVGFARVAINEFPDLRTRLVDIDDAPATLAALASELVSGSQEDEVALRGPKRYVNRLVRRTMADLSESQDQGATDPAAAEVIVALQRATLFGSRDAAGARSPVGEAFGVVLSAGSEAGDFQPGDSVVFSLEAHPAPSMTVQAKRLTPNTAGVQLPWLLAEYGLTQVGKLAPGQTVCVHVDLNPLALALVRSAVQAGARVVATAAGDALQHACRALGAEQVFSPHSADLRQLLMQAGSADGVDLSINATLRPISSRHLTVLKPYGTHIDLYDGERSNWVDLADAPGSICLIQLELQSLRERCQAHRPTVQKIAARLSAGSRDLPLIKHYDSTQAEGAVAIVGQDEMASIDFMWDVDTMRIRQAMAHSRFAPDETYLLTGGFGGFGLQMAAWMIERGARHLVLVGRKGAHTPEARAAVERLGGTGANVVPYAADVSDENAVQRMIQHVEQTMPPLRGVFHAAAVLDDGPIDGLADANFAKVLNAKSAGAWHLHRATEHLPLRYFVLFSSIGSLVGSPGQATYVAANAFLDALAQLRRARGMAGLSINWGALAEVGMAARHREVADYLDRVGFGTFTPSVAMAVLGRLLEANPVVIGAAAMDWATLSSFYPAWGRSLRNQEIFGALIVEQTGDTGWQWSELLSPLSPEERLTTLAGLLNQTVADVLKLPQDRIDPSQSLLNMGMDSIMAIELQVQIESRFGVKLSTLELMRGNSLASLNEHLLRMLLDEASSSAAEPPAGAAAPTSQAAIDHAGSDMTVARLSQLDIRDLHVAIDNMSDEDVERALALLDNDTGVK